MSALTSQMNQDMAQRNHCTAAARDRHFQLIQTITQAGAFEV